MVESGKDVKMDGGKGDGVETAFLVIIPKNGEPVSVQTRDIIKGASRDATMIDIMRACNEILAHLQSQMASQAVLGILSAMSSHQGIVTPSKHVVIPK